MGAFDVVNHLLNLLLPAVALGALASSLTKLLWRRQLAPVPWRRLAVPAMGASAAVLLAGLVLSGRDGRMATYGAMVVACAVTLWWRAFGPGRH